MLPALYYPVSLSYSRLLLTEDEGGGADGLPPLLTKGEGGVV